MNTGAGQNTSTDSGEFQRRIIGVFKQINNFMANRGNDRLVNLWPEWEQRFKWLYRESKKQPTVEISLVGGTGAGKSTLLNALIGARVLPVSNMRACTAAISEVAYYEGAYRCRVEFLSRESWEHEVEILQSDLQDSRTGSEAGDSGHPGVGISTAARDKLWTVYRDSDETTKEEFDPFQIIEPDEIQEALAQGEIEFEETDLKAFRTEISKYLDSKHRFWPIVKTVSIQGPFPALRDGAKLVDLPGVNDPNEAREEVTRSHLKTCRFVWIVFNIKRALTKDTINLMQSDDFLRQIVMDGRTDALTFVGTASDDVDVETGIEEFGLDEDSDTAQIVSARNQAVRKVVHDQLDELSARMAQLAKESPEEAGRLAKRLKSSQILTVSAREYLRIAGLAKTNPAGLSHKDETEIPALQNHMRAICQNYGVSAHIGALHRQLGLLIAEIKREIQAQKVALKNQANVSEQHRKEIVAAVQAARKFLDRDLDDAQERLAQDLESGQSLLAERIKRAVDRARLDLEETTLKRWARMHHSTLRAACRRQGVYFGTTGRTDLPADLCKPILDGIAFAWSEFFGDKLRQILEKWKDKLCHHAERHRRQLLDSLRTTGDLAPEVTTSLSSIFENTERVLDELLAQLAVEMDNKVTEKQRTLYDQVPEQVKANMQQAFMQASNESGWGMKGRIVQILGESARRVSRVMFDDARDVLLNGVRSLNDWLCREYKKMTDAVKRNSSLAADNLVSGEGRLSQEKLEQEMQLLDEWESLMAEFETADAA